MSSGNWEWRVFFKIDEASSSYSVLPKNHHDVEERVDVYKSLGHSSLGLKARSNDTFHEIKVLVNNDDDDDDVGWQCWIKCFAQQSHSPSELKSQMEASRSMKRVNKALHGHAISFLDQIIHRDSKLSSTATKKKKKKDDVLSTIRFEKRRVQIYDPTSGLVEQTDLAVFHSQGEFIGNYRTICVEGSPHSPLPRRILNEIEQHGLLSKHTTMIGGYPAFVEQLLKHTTSCEG